MLHSYILGFLLGLGAAIPLGPLNIEIIRRNLILGVRYGVFFGFGACSADLIYLILLSLGALTLLTHPIVLKTVGVVGSCIIAWFGFSALRIKNNMIDAETVKPKNKPVYMHYLQALSLTLLNPYTIIFWASVSSQVAGLVKHADGSIIGAGVGVATSTVLWVISLNALLHFTRHKFSKRQMQTLNIIGGVLLLFFALFGLIHFLW